MIWIMKKLSDINPISDFSSETIGKKKDALLYVEGPLVNACEIFYEKNIETYMSNANKNSIGHSGYCYLSIVYDNLSEKNKEICERLCKSGKGKIGKARDGKTGIVEFRLHTNDIDLDIAYVEKFFVEIANEFKNQELTWGFLSVTSYATKLLRMPAEDENVKKLIYTIINEGDPYGRYYDKKSRLIFVSKEFYNKWEKSH